MTTVALNSAPHARGTVNQQPGLAGSVGMMVHVSRVSVPTDAKPVSISSWSKALSSSLARAEERDRTSTQVELKALADRTDRKVFEGDWSDDWVTLAAERPKASDEERAELSRDVTAFMKRFNAVAGRGSAIRHENPFFGLQRDALLAIQYDESGAFTTNERRAALIESNRQYCEWANEICKRLTDARASQESPLPVYRDLLSYYESLPSIEVACLPDDYIGTLRSLISMEKGPDSYVDDAQRIMPLLLQWLNEPEAVS